MRSTVGPLPPAVYWRRRAVVLGALLLVLVVLFVSCSGGGDKGSKRGAGNGAPASQAPTPAPDGTGGSPEPETSFTDENPGEPDLPDPKDLQSGAPTATGDGTATGSNNNVTAPAGTCTDQEVSVTPTPAVTTIKKGTSVKIEILIKNVSARACNRDLGAGAQELYLDQGARKLWSSDTCSTDRSANLISMRPGGEARFAITWNGRQSTKCTGGMPDGPPVEPGHYQIRARLDRKLSQPVTLSVTA